VARSLDPDFDMWSTSEPVVSEWISRNLGPVGKIEEAMEGVGELSRLLSQVPELATRAERLSRELDAMGERGIRLDPLTVKEIGKAEARQTRWGRVALWVIAVVAIILLLRLVL
jgi:ubiquinone biosynthesis protein